MESNALRVKEGALESEVGGLGGAGFNPRSTAHQPHGLGKFLHVSEISIPFASSQSSGLSWKLNYNIGHS